MPGAHGNSHLYVVTAKHLAERMESAIVIGFNHRDSGQALLEEDSVHWYVHPTEASAVDVAVTPFASAQRDLLDLEPVPEHLFTSGERMRKAPIGVGDEITAIGMFTRFSDEDHHAHCQNRPSGNAADPAYSCEELLRTWKRTSPKSKG